MRGKHVSKKILALFTVFFLTLIIIKGREKIASFVTEEIIKKNDIIGGAIEGKKSVLNRYMPVVGYVDTHYVQTMYIDDPSYEDEYIDENVNEGITEEIYEESGVGEEYTEAASVQDNRTGLVKFDRNMLTDFDSLVDRFYTVTSITELTEDTFDVDRALDTNLTILGDNTSPQILIFHTHSQEYFKDSTEGDINTGIVGVGTRLSEILSRDYGYNVIHDTSVYDYANGVLDRSKAYTLAEKGIQSILAEYPTVEVILDIHRDGVREDIHLVQNVNGKETAKIMFFNGISYTKVKGKIDYLYNPYIQDNLSMSLQMYLLGEMYYPGLLRKNYINGYRYCLHFKPKSMLIEVGAQNNSLEEELNAMEPLADILDRLLKGEKAYE